MIGIACPDRCPLVAFISLLAPAVIRGNTVVIIPSQSHPMVAVDMYQVFPWHSCRVTCLWNFARVRMFLPPLSPLSNSIAENTDMKGFSFLCRQPSNEEQKVGTNCRMVAP